MSDEQLGADDPVQAQPQRDPDYSEPDGYLQMLIEIVNGTDVKFPVTLFVKGVVVSGALVSGHKYFEGMAQSFAEFLGEGHSPETVANLTVIGKNYEKEQDAPDYPPPIYIHLQKARVFVPGVKPIPDEGLWWRGRVSEVDGFSFGMLGFTQT